MSADGQLVYLSGPPGVGKSTLMAHLTRYCGRTPITGLIPHDLLTLPADNRARVQFGAVELGRRREQFSGTDALSMSIQPRAVEFMARPGMSRTLVLGEGDRLATVSFLGAASRLGWNVTLIHLEAPVSLLDARCAQRGSTQNVAWRRGRISKARNLAAAVEAEGWPLIRLDSRNSVECLSADLVAAVPVLTALLPSYAEELNQ